MCINDEPFKAHAAFLEHTDRGDILRECEPNDAIQPNNFKSISNARQT